jgi:hypothetical protein|tara:strand:+ start:272 stop:448 length:177 start_codon:yes stop_codon:yes gene_type:complete
MQVGDLVKHFLTEQIGIVLDVGFHNIHVMWTTQGLSMFGPGSKEWSDARSLEVISESR